LKISFINIVFFLFILCVSYFITAQGIVTSVNASDVNIREGPGLDKKIIDHLQKGEELILIDVRGDWYYVEYGENKNGWIFKDFIVSATPVVKNTQVIINTPVPVLPEEKIVFATNSGIKIINNDGTNLKDLTTVEGDNFPVWSPDGKRIVFINYREGRCLYIINRDGTGRKKIAENLSVMPYAEWAKIGKIMFFAVEFVENLYYTNIFTLIEGGMVKNISQKKDNSDSHPLMAPDNSLIAFCSRRDRNSEVYVMKPDGTNQRNLTVHPAEDIPGAWSKSSKSIVFTSNRDSDYKSLKVTPAPREIYLVKVETLQTINLTDNSGDDYNPVVSPDGNRILFLSHRDRINDYASIFVMKSTGKDVIEITDIKGDKSNISWAPGGSEFVFQLNQDGKNYIYIMNIKGKNKPFLLSEGFSPQWCPKQ